MKLTDFIYTTVIFGVCFGIISGQTRARDLHGYETGQLFDRKIDFINKSTKELERSQAYLWEAWVQRKKVAFSIYDYNREGDRVNMTVYVEPGTNGDWQVEKSTVIDRCDSVGAMKRSCRATPVVRVYDAVRWENLKLFTLPKLTETGVKILVLVNSKTGDRYELRRGALF